MDLRFLGSILLIIGTAIGAGLLALPIATAQSGLFFSTLLMIVIWFSMTCSALLILEVNLRLPLNTNLISMAKHTLGRPAAAILWLAYMCLLYSLIAAYSAGGSDVVYGLLSLIHAAAPHWIDTLIFLSVLIYIVYKGIRSVDWANRGLMIIKFTVFFCLLFLILPHMKTHRLTFGDYRGILPAVMVVVTSFGFAIIIPTLRVYLKSNRKQLYSAICLGSFIALACYLLWVFTIHSNIPQSELIAIQQSGEPISGLAAALIKQIHTPIIVMLVHIFTSICMVTSFLGVALSLTDFVADGLGLKKVGKSNITIYAVSFLPPLITVLFFPGIFIKALSYAGLFCVIILLLFPALMAWQIRKEKSDKDVYQLWGGNQLLYIIMLFAVLLLALGVRQVF